MNLDVHPYVIGLATAVGIGLLIGLERERRKSQARYGSIGGIRTFALTALLGAAGSLVGGDTTIVVLVIAVGALAVAGYLRSSKDDPGLTTEIALVLTFVLGAMAIQSPGMAGSLGVLVAIFLAARRPMHAFVKDVLTEQEVHDGLLLAAAALIILPLTPNRTIDPLEVFNPRSLWTLAVLMMAINAAGYVALRIAGPRYGLSIAGFASGFVSSTATIAAMAARAGKNPELRRVAVSGAILSSVATVVQLAVILGATSRAALGAAAIPLLCAGAVALTHGGIYAFHSAKETKDHPVAPGRAFDPKVALIFAATIGGVLMLAALVTQWLGSTGLWLATGLAGFADAHAPAAAAGAMSASGQISADQVVVPVLLAFSTNAITKVVVAITAGGRAFAVHVIPGIVLMVVAAWLGAGLSVLF
jgi:uncharacterized membrane protein (DUF4010 family)